MLNLFILVIIEQFEKYYLTANNPLTQFSLHLETFKKHRQDQTIKYKCLKIQERHVIDLYMRLPPPLGEQEGTKKSEVKKKLLRMGIRTDNNGFIYFNELLYKLMREIYCTFKLNNTMAKYELVTQYRLFLLRKKA